MSILTKTRKFLNLIDVETGAKYTWVRRKQYGAKKYNAIYNC